MARNPGPDGASRRRESAQDGLIMETNNSSIVSKRSVERLYYPEPHFFRYFVRKPQRRSPLINRGYWLRMRLIENRVLEFLKFPVGPVRPKKKIVVNLGCGYDPLPFQLLKKFPECTKNAIFIDVDHEQLVQKKCHVITQTPQLSDLISDFNMSPPHDSVLLVSSRYLAIGCDLRDTARLEDAIKSEMSLEQCDVLFVAEVSLTYMEVSAADAVIAWASRLTTAARFCILEQFLPGGPNHPFARTMLKHFEKLQAPLRSIHHQPSLKEQEQRFIKAGWTRPHAMSLWQLWQSTYTSVERREIDLVEPFDEWEEFALFASHYFMLEAQYNGTAHIDKDVNKGLGNFIRVPTTISQWNLTYHEDPKVKCRRRYGAVVPHTEYVIGHHGGMGSTNRLQSTDIYSLSSRSSTMSLPPSTVRARMYHTITNLEHDECLLVGGRSSPEKAMADCWLRQEGQWSQIYDLPTPRYRHCAAMTKLNANTSCVLIYGGKQSAFEVLGDWLLWQPEFGWRSLATSSTHGKPPAFDEHGRFPAYGTYGKLPAPRFSASLICLGNDYGVLFGGLNQDGCVLDDAWSWKLGERDGAIFLELEICSSRWGTYGDGRPLDCITNRFGAAVCDAKEGFIVVGGISGHGVLQQRDEIAAVRLESLARASDYLHRVQWLDIFEAPPTGVRPLLVGHCLSNGNMKKLQILGGGAVCFSFGTYWNEGTWTLQESGTQDRDRWALVDAHRTDVDYTKSHDAEQSSISQASTELPIVARVEIKSALEFDQLVNKSHPMPTIFDGLDIGQCTKLWTADYLRSKIGSDRIVTVHESKSQYLNFQSKNFEYVKKNFGDFLDQIAAGEKQYLRATSRDKPADIPVDLCQDFPEIAADFRLPSELEMVTSNAHSSPLRVSGPVIMWLHYDVMANVLCQVQGTKRLVLYPPSDVSALSFPPGASSSTINVFENGPTMENTHPVEAILRPGDVLFIPPLWLHTAAPTENLSIAVNVFFRNLTKGYAPGRDVYGNRDLVAYENGRKDIARLINNFKDIPGDMSRFYLERLADELKEKAKTADI